MRLVFFGSGAFGLPTLAHLARTGKHHIAAIVTQPDKPAGRGGKLTPTPIAEWAADHLPGVPILKPPKVNAPEIVAEIDRLAVAPSASSHPTSDIPHPTFVVIAFGQKLSTRLLENAFAINLHASLLPRWRGAAPINAAILAGDKITGNSIITLADRMDAGLILAQTDPPIPIDPLTTAGELHDVLAADGPALVERVLDQHAAGSLSPRHQVESEVTIATKLSKSDGQIDFHQPADFLRRQVHALTPWPGVGVHLLSPQNQSPPIPIKLLRVRVAPPHPIAAEPGQLIDPLRGVVCCGNRTALEILELQPAGKRPMDWAAFARGRPIPPGSRLVSPDA
ncbi:MAG: methionyl-tRNA formyltransferase [Phycisphaeraceae bacterium]|nr:methionyl-tRNA formyltransferase [Phycisphaeraceae bacterium]